jgi:hypothetical protein
MKKILLTVVLLLFSYTAFADTTTYFRKGRSAVGVVEYYWYNCDTDSEIVTGTQSDAIYGYLVTFKVVPDSSNPPDSSWSLELRDEGNFDWLFGEGAALDGTDKTNSANIDVPVTDSGGYPYLHGERLTPYASGMGTSYNNCYYLYIRVKEE